MSTPLQKNLKKYGISTVISLLIAYVFVYLRVDMDHPEATALVDWYLILCDAFTVPGLLFLMFGLMMSLSNQGALDGVGYVAKAAFRMLVPGMALNMERYKEYLERRRANRIKGYGFLYVVALANMAVSGVFMVLFYSLYK
ncbi:MAG: DUF3899 domain-containing protein [Clostridia bacterium]|nr:DUF3899 domain-containing protein [Clostridia bacterium]